MSPGHKNEQVIVMHGSPSAPLSLDRKEHNRKIQHTAAILACRDGGIGVDPPPLPFDNKPVTPFDFGGRGAGRVIVGCGSIVVGGVSGADMGNRKKVES